MTTARALLSEAFPPLLREELEKGMSFPAARASALKRMRLSDGLLQQPNDILAVEYCKAILAQNSPMEPFPIHREGSYHAEIADSDNPSATAVRNLMLIARNWKACVPPDIREILAAAPLHSLEAGERAMLAKLRTMTDGEFEALPYGSEGLWRKFMHACRGHDTLENILTATKSKRYTRTRLDRMMMCAFLGLTKEDLSSPAPYARVLGFTKRGQQVLHTAKEHTTLYNVGQRVDHPQWAIEQRCNDLYGLFAQALEPAGMESKRRVIVL
jgi:predicted nucleotidyltransferase